MKLRSGKLASLAAQPSASLPLAPSHFPTLAKGKENDEAIAHHTAAHLSSYCSSPLAGVWCRRRWWPDFALRGVAKKLLLGMHITVEWGGLDGTRSVWHGTVRSTMPLLIFYKEDDDLYPFPPRRPVRISQLAVDYQLSLCSKARRARLLRMPLRRAMASAVALSGTSWPDCPFRDSLPAARHMGRGVRRPVPVVGRQFLVASFNCRSAAYDGAILAICAWADAKKISIVALQETRRSNEEDFTVGEGWRFINFSSDNGVGGAGILLSPDASRRLTKFSGSSRHLVATFGSFSVVNIHAPTAVHPEDRDRFFSFISSLLPRDSENVFLIGDFNARLVDGRQSVMAKAAKDQFLDFLQQSALSVIKPPTFTFVSATGKRSALDYVVCKTRFRSSVFSLNVAKMAPIPSDHFPIIATLRIHFARIECSQLDPKPDLSYFASPENCQRFAQKFQNISSYTEFSAAFDVAKQMVPPVKPSTSHRTWKTDVAKKVMAMNNNIGLDGRILSNFLEAQDSAQVTLFVHHYSSMLRQNPRLAWDFVRRSMFRSPSSTFPAATQEERLSKLTAHFRTLFSSDGGPGPPNWGTFSQSLQFETGAFSEVELQAALAKLSNGKSTGLDTIPNEVLKVKELRSSVLNIMNHALLNGVPDEWHHTALIPLPKKGDLSDPSNWRGIALMQASAKLFNLLLLLRIRGVVDKFLLSAQNGFRPQRSTVHHIVAVKLLLGDAALRRMPLHGCFVDFRKAFDSVTWHSVEAALLFWHVPLTLRQSIMSIYRGHHVQVRCGSVCGQQIAVEKGVLQGDTLAPFLFVLIVDQILRRLPAHEGIDVSILAASRGTASRPHTSARTYIPALAYADDILLLSHSSAGLQALFSSLEAEGKRVGLLINMGKAKTERFVVNDSAGDVKNDKGAAIPVVNAYKYLGVNVLQPHHDINSHIAKAWCALRSCRAIWKSGASIDAKRSLFTALVEPIFSYGLE